MFRCGKLATQCSPLTRGIKSVARTQFTTGTLLRIEGVQSRCLSSAALGRGHQQRAEPGLVPQVLLGNVSGHGSWGRSWQRHAGSQAGSGSNTAYIAGGAAAVIVGGLLFMSSGIAMTDPTTVKKTEKTVTEKKDNPAEEPKKVEETAAPAEETATAEPVPEPPKFPTEVKYLIIGAGTAAMTASKTIRKNDPTAKVLMVTNENYRPYMRPPLSKELWFNGADAKALSFKDWAGKDKNIFYQDDEFFLKPEDLDGAESGGTSVASNKTVNRLDVGSQVAYLADGSEIKYEKCLIATGGKPRTLPIFKNMENECKDRIHYFRGIDDFQRLFAAAEKSKAVLVVGGGFLGSELAVALAQKAKGTDLKVYQAFPEKGNMGLVFPEYLSEWTMGKMRDAGVTVYPETFVSGCSYNKETSQLDFKTQSGFEVSADHVVVAVGLQPSTDLAETSGLEVDPTHGGFLVNAELEARKNLWVAGDAACFYDIGLGRRRVEHHDHAVVSGRLAGNNMSSDSKPYWHQSMFWSDLGPSIGYEAIGICDSSLPTFAVFAKATEKDTPKAVVEETGEGLRSETEGESAAATAGAADVPAPVPEGDNYGKGVIFYTNKDKIVGVVMWNLFGRMPAARQVLKENKPVKDFTEVAKLFDVHDQKKKAQS